MMSHFLFVPRRAVMTALGAMAIAVIGATAASAQSTTSASPPPAPKHHSKAKGAVVGAAAGAVVGGPVGAVAGGERPDLLAYKEAHPQSGDAPCWSMHSLHDS